MVGGGPGLPWQIRGPTWRQNLVRWLTMFCVENGASTCANHTCGSAGLNGGIFTVTADTKAGSRETTAAEGESSAAGSSCLAMMRDLTSGCGEVVEFTVVRSSGSSQDRDHVRVTNVVDQGPGELARTARSRTNSASNSTTASDSTSCLCTARG